MEDYNDYFLKAEITTRVHAMNTLPLTILSKISKENIISSHVGNSEILKIESKLDSTGKGGLFTCSIENQLQENTNPSLATSANAVKKKAALKDKKWMKRI